jgi:hypothetical protein
MLLLPVSDSFATYLATCYRRKQVTVLPLVWPQVTGESLSLYNGWSAAPSGSDLFLCFYRLENLIQIFHLMIKSGFKMAFVNIATKH